jgi:hypothetical protein
MGMLPIGVVTPGWPENTWAVEYPVPPDRWTARETRAFLGAMSRLVPPRTADPCDFEMTTDEKGVMLRVWRTGEGEARTYSPVMLPVSTLQALGAAGGSLQGTLVLDEAERTLAESLALNPMGGAV